MVLGETSGIIDLKSGDNTVLQSGHIHIESLTKRPDLLELFATESGRDAVPARLRGIVAQNNVSWVDALTKQIDQAVILPLKSL